MLSSFPASVLSSFPASVLSSFPASVLGVASVSVFSTLQPYAWPFSPQTNESLSRLTVSAAGENVTVAPTSSLVDPSATESVNLLLGETEAM